jgi:ribosomal-protein-alanine N-acetyltransferase
MTVILRPWTLDDAALFADMMSRVDFTYEDEELWCKDAKEARNTLESMIRKEDYNGDFYCAVLLDGEVVGHVQAVRLKGFSIRDGQVGCMVVREAAGRGVGTEAVRQMVEMAFTRRSYDRLTAIIYSPNKASQRMVEKVGFTLEAKLQANVWKNGYFYDAYVYGLLREDTGIPTTHCCEPDDEFSPEEKDALEPSLVPPRVEEWPSLEDIERRYKEHQQQSN